VFAERIKILRQQKDLSQQELAKIVGKTQQAVGLWEKEGGNEPDHETLNKLADYFNVSTDYLLGRTDDPAAFDDVRQHINDDEALEYLDHLHKRPEMKTLFSVSRKATKEDIETAITLIEALKRKSQGEDHEG
jgi:transcriptional regulator with XRE-family HTH domain